jgi:hypothetical protein
MVVVSNLGLLEADQFVPSNRPGHAQHQTGSGRHPLFLNQLVGSPNFPAPGQPGQWMGLRLLTNRPLGASNHQDPDDEPRNTFQENPPAFG